MKRALFSLVVFAASGLAAGAASVTAPSQVTEVTVYQDRALVTRSASVPLAAGEQQVVFEGLPAGLDENSVRARGQGRGYKILGVEIRRDYQKTEENEQTKKLRGQIKALQQKIQDLEDERGDLNQKRELLRKLGDNLGAGGDKAPAAVADLKTFADYYGAQLAATSVRLRGIERGCADLTKQRNELNSQLATLTRPGSPDRRTVVVTVSADAATSAGLQVDYLIHGCSWQPQYDVHYQAGSKNLALTAYGIIRQNSGESWDSVKVTLSTARPQQGTSLPDLTAWTLNVREHAPAAPLPVIADAPLEAAKQNRKDENRFNNTAAVGEYLGGGSADSASQSRLYGSLSGKLATASVETQGFSAAYKVPATVSVPSDGQPHRCTISVMELAAAQSYASTPKLNPGAFVKAKVKNANAAPLLPGQLNVFMGNDFVGSSRLSLVGPEGVFDLFLGKDDTLKVQRKDKTRREETSGVFSKSKVVKMGYTIELENFQNQDVTVSVKDQIPVSQNEKIKVSYKASAKVAEENKETGELTWTLTVPAKKKVALDVDFQVECPPDVTVSGI
jgi:uncharacterized protein (TIGR02231 family)